MKQARENIIYKLCNKKGAFLLISAFLFSLLFLFPPGSVQSSRPYTSSTHGFSLYRTLWSNVPSKILRTGKYLVEWSNPLFCGPKIRIYRVSDRKDVIWETSRGEAFFSLGTGSAKIFESRGSYRIHDYLKRRFCHQSVDELSEEDGAVIINGSFLDSLPPLRYRVVFKGKDDGGVDFDFQAHSGSCEEGRINRAFMIYKTSADERFFGFGAQYSYLDMKGKRVPVLVQEQGIGRGLQPLTFLMNLFAGSGGDAFSTYAAVPFYLTNHLRSMFLKNPEYSVFDLTDPTRVTVSLFSRRIRGRILAGSSPLEIIEKFTRYSGRMAELPEWVGEGAIVCVQGGSTRVRETVRRLRENGVPVSAVWIHDWCGRRRTIAGSQLWWNWEPDPDLYPDFPQLVKEIRAQGIRVLTYLNPFLVDVSEKPSYRRNLFLEAKEKGYLVRKKDGEPYLIPNTDFSAGMVDLSNKKAREWVKEIIKCEFLDAGVSGWMADYAEALPFDCLLEGGNNPARFHNRYPEEWAKLNREAIREAGLEGEVIFFTRSGFTKSPGFSTLFWLGDQLVNWDEHDGIKSALTGLLSSGISGFSLNHSDIGGYTTIGLSWLPGFGYTRSKELLLRWIEMNAFTAVFRTHEGNMPELNCQWDRDAETIRQFARFAKIYETLHFYRRELLKEASSSGYPLVRPLFLHYPGDPEAWGIKEEFMLGSEFLIAPCLQPGADEVRLYLPAGRWVHLWSGKVFGNTQAGEWLRVPSPIGEPPVFYRYGSQVGEKTVEDLRVIGVLNRVSRD